MSELDATLVRLSAELDQLGVLWALIGGLAVSVRAEPRTTRDIDIAVAVSSDREAEDLVKALRARGYRERPDTLLLQTAANRIATVRLDPPTGSEGVVVDLLFASSGIETETVRAADRLEILPRLRVPVASTGHLIALKVLAGRPLDRADASNLLAEATPSDLRVARQGLDLIDRRGYSRGKDLLRELERLLGGDS